MRLPITIAYSRQSGTTGVTYLFFRDNQQRGFYYSCQRQMTQNYEFERLLKELSAQYSSLERGFQHDIDNCTRLIELNYQYDTKLQVRPPALTPSSTSASRP